ncbi:MAG: glyoxalase superfamily protein [Pannonibacter sp.]
MRDFLNAKAMAKALREQLAERGHTLPHSDALEIVARQLGLATWNVLSAKIEDATQTALASQKATDGFLETVPIVRIFDVTKAHDFYLGFLGMSVDWEHRYGPEFPLYTQVSRGQLKLHLSEHAGDATPGGNMCVYMAGIRAFHVELTAKNYRYMRPSLEQTDGRTEMQVVDPFNNRIRFMELDPD